MRTAGRAESGEIDDTAAEIRKTYLNHSRKEPFMYYYRDKDSKEIDIVPAGVMIMIL